MMLTKSIAICVAAFIAATSVDAATRNLRAEHEGAGPHTHAPGSVDYTSTGQGGAPVTTVNMTPGSSTTNVNVNPGTITTNVNIAPGTSTTTVNGAVPASAPASAPAAAAAQPSSGLGFGSLLGGLNPLSSVATMAHVAHGALLGHTGTLPSSYMQGKGAGGH